MFCNRGITVLMLAGMLLFICMADLAHARGITVTNGVRVSFNNAAIIDVHCDDISVENGGTLSLGNGQVDNCRNFTLDSGATFNDDTGTLNLNGLWTNNTDFVKGASSTIQFNTNCGETNDATGTGDTDDDGVADQDEPDGNGDGLPDILVSNPIILWPTNGNINVPLNAIIQTDQFNAFNIAMSEWQISRINDFSSLSMGVTSDTSLTELNVPDMVLTGDTEYYSRVRFINDLGEPSSWSGVVSFVTEADPFSDLNMNGVPDDQEVDDNLDLDENAVPDVEQDGIKCVNVNDNQQICVKVSDNVASIDALKYVALSSIDDNANCPDELPKGLISFRASLISSTDPASVIVYFSEQVVKNSGWYKYDTINGWQDYTDYTSINNNRLSMIIDFQDGEFGDADGVANGVIVDPSGPGTELKVPGDSDDRGDSGGCFINSLTF